MIGLRPLIRLSGSEFKRLRAGARIAWRYALMMELAKSASRNYRFDNLKSAGELEGYLRTWRKSGESMSAKLRHVLGAAIAGYSNPEERIARLAAALQIARLQDLLVDVFVALVIQVRVLIDRLDGGYEPDPVAIGLSSGVVQLRSMPTSGYSARTSQS